MSDTAFFLNCHKSKIRVPNRLKFSVKNDVPEIIQNCQVLKNDSRRFVEN